MFVVYLFALLRLVASTDVPIIGILSQRTYSVDHLFPDDDYHSFISASYVKYVESAGARVVPIMIGRDVNYYKEIVDHTNGILFPGGATYFNESGGYAVAGQMIYDYVVEINKNGDYYPIWGTCLGFQLLPFLALNGTDIRTDCSAINISMPLNFKEDFKTSKIFSNVPEQIVNILSEKVTYNNHRYCVTEDSLRQYGLVDDWRVVSTNEDVNGHEFISTIESKRYPFYGIEFHAEKNRFEFAGPGIPHGVDAVKMSQFFSDFFVEEARRNDHAFPDWKSEQDALIYNYVPKFTGRQNSSYLQLYMFDRDQNSGVERNRIVRF